MVKQGSTAAGAVGVVTEPGVPKQTVLQIALAQLKRVQSFNPIAPPSGVAGVIPGYPMGPYNCTTSGSYVLDIQDTDNSGTFTVGDVFTMSFTACKEPNPAKAGSYITTNGSMSLTINSASGSGTANSPIVMSVTMSFNNFSTVDTAPTTPETITMSGDITLAINDNGTTLTAGMSGTSFSTNSTSDGAFSLKNYNISSSEDIASPFAYSYTVGMTTNCAALGGDIVISAPTPFTGSGTGNPTAGVMKISGDNNSYITLTANADGQHVLLEVNDGTSATQPVLSKTVTWDAI
jgi:hypothetical protein